MELTEEILEQFIGKEETDRILEELETVGIRYGDEGRPVPKDTTIYRIEMPNGEGPYNSGLPNAKEIYETICSPEPGYFCVKNAILNRERCGITEREFYEAHGDAAYGCDSIECLKDWFPDKAREYLAKQGAKVVEYKLPKGTYMLTLPRGERVFARPSAKRVGVMDVISFRKA